MLKKIGTFPIGAREIELYTDTTSGNGSFDHNQPMVHMIIGLQHCSWWHCLEVALHEALELILSDLNCRYVPDVSYGDTADEYIFHFSHPQFSEAMGRLGNFMAAITPELSTAYDDFQNPKKRKKKRVSKSKRKDRQSVRSGNLNPVPTSSRRRVK